MGFKERTLKFVDSYEKASAQFPPNLAKMGFHFVL